MDTTPKTGLATSLVIERCRSVMVAGLSPMMVHDRRRAVSDERNERLPIIMRRDTREPLLNENRYLLDIRWSLTGSSLVTAARHLAHIAWWSVAQMPDFSRMLRAGKVPNMELIRVGLLGWLRVESIQARRTCRRLYVGNNTFNARLAVLQEYMIWNLTNYASDRTTNAADAGHCRHQIESLERVFQRHRASSQDPEQRFALSDEKWAELMEVIRPYTSRNPWRGYICRRRNEVILRLLFSTGVRRGELGNLRTDDVVIVAGEPFIRVIRRPDDKLDPRERQPQVKSLPRAIPIDDELLHMLEDYINQVRPLTPRALNHPYLFVCSRTGVPLCLGALNEVVAGLSNVLDMAIFPHIARHTFTSALESACKEAGRSEKDTETALMSANGWRSKETVKTYTQKNIEERRIEATRQYQSDIFGI